MQNVEQHNLKGADRYGSFSPCEATALQIFRTRLPICCHNPLRKVQHIGVKGLIIQSHTCQMHGGNAWRPRCVGLCSAKEVLEDQPN